MTSAIQGRTVSELIAAVFTEVLGLWRQEAALARTEMTGNVKGAAIGLGLVAAGAVLLIPAAFVLLFACVTALMAFGFAGYWAALIVAGVILLISFSLLAIGVFRLKATSLIPRKAVSQLRRDSSHVKSLFRAEP